MSDQDKPANPEGTPERAKPHSDEIRELKWLSEHRDEYTARLLHNIKAHLPELEQLVAEVEDHWGLEDAFYRFYHGSFKVYYIQGWTEEVVKAFQALLPDRPLNTWFCKIIGEGTGKKLEEST